jgi:hypothetical protein
MFLIQRFRYESKEKTPSMLPPPAPALNLSLFKRVKRKNTYDVSLLAKEYVPLNWTKVKKEGKSNNGRFPPHL